MTQASRGRKVVRGRRATQASRGRKVLRGRRATRGVAGPVGPIGPEGPPGTGGGGVVTSSVWTLLFEAGAGVNDRLDTGSATVRAATYTLETDETFSGYDELACWIDNSSGREAKFMYLLVSHFITTLGTAGNWVDWSDNRWCGVSYRTDTTFQVVGNGMGIRRIYGRASTGWRYRRYGRRWCYGGDGRSGQQRRNGGDGQHWPHRPGGSGRLRRRSDSGSDHVPHRRGGAHDRAGARHRRCGATQEVLILRDHQPHEVVGGHREPPAA